MAWFDRFRPTNVIRSIGRIIRPGRQEPPQAPPQRPQAPRQGEYRPPIQPVQPPPRPQPPPPPPPPPPPEAPMVPTDSGAWVPADQLPEAPWPEWMGTEATMYDPETFDPIQTDYPMTVQDWYMVSLMPGEMVWERYGLGNIDILHQLEDFYGYPVDWDEWRETYNEVMAG